MAQMKMLSIDKALMLYKLLKPHLSEERSGEFLDFADEVIKDMNKDDPAAYVHCLELLSDLDISELSEMDSLEALGIFLDGLAANNVFKLIEFSEFLGL